MMEGAVFATGPKSEVIQLDKGSPWIAPVCRGTMVMNTETHKQKGTYKLHCGDSIMIFIHV